MYAGSPKKLHFRVITGELGSVGGIREHQIAHSQLTGKSFEKGWESPVWGTYLHIRARWFGKKLNQPNGMDLGDKGDKRGIFQKVF